MTPAEFADAMRSIDTDHDLEMAHVAADDLMCQLLIHLGYSEGVMAFTAMEKWYA